MSRNVPYERDLICDSCGKQGTFDFMGDYYCDDCLAVCEDCSLLFVEKKSPIRHFCWDCKEKVLDK